ncbi:hypothetical protein GCM10009714_31810 [Microlunatus capsulatus]
MIACLANFAAEPRTDYRIGLPAEGVWEEILNTDSEVYDGTGQFGNLGRVVAGAVPSHGYPASATVTIPPLGSVWFRFLPVAEEATPEEDARVEAGQRAVAKQASPRSRTRAVTTTAPEAGADDASAAPKRSRRSKADAKPSQPAATAGTASAARPDAKNKAAVASPSSAPETPVEDPAPAPAKRGRTRRSAG